MSHQTPISTKKSSFISTHHKFSPPPVLQPKAEKKPDAKLPEWKPGGTPTAVSPLQRLIDSKAAQAKLTIGQPNDKYEQKADRVARDVVQRINSPVSETPQQETVQRQSTEFVEDELQMKPFLQRVLAVGGEDAPSDIEAGINRAKGGGQPLHAGLQRSMGEAMGADFSRVRVHTDRQSDQLNRSIQAKAFTTGRDIFFRQGEYNPSSTSGQELIAHELTHTIQQNGNALQRSLEPLSLDPESPEGDYLAAGETPSTGTMVVQRLISTSDWKKASKLSFFKNRSSEVKAIDTALDEYHKISPEDTEAKIAALQEIKQKIAKLRKAKQGADSARDPALNRLYGEVIKELLYLGAYDEEKYLEPLTPEDEANLELELEGLSDESSVTTDDQLDDVDLSDLELEAETELGQEFSYEENPGDKALKVVSDAIAQWVKFIEYPNVQEAKAAESIAALDENIQFLRNYISECKKLLPSLIEYHEKTAPELEDLLVQNEEINQVLSQPMNNQVDNEELEKELKELDTEDVSSKSTVSEDDLELAKLEDELDDKSGSKLNPVIEPDELVERLDEATDTLPELIEIKQAFLKLVGERQKLDSVYTTAFEKYIAKNTSIREEDVQELIDSKNSVTDRIIDNCDDAAGVLDTYNIDIPSDMPPSSLIDSVIELSAEKALDKQLVAILVEDRQIIYLLTKATKQGAQTVTGEFDFVKGAEAFLTLLQKALGLTTVYSVTSADIGLKISLGVTADLLAKAFELGGGIFITLKGLINVSDDRRLRSGGALTLGVTGKATAFWRFFKVSGVMQKTLGIGGTFDDLKHYVAWIFQRLQEMKDGLKTIFLQKKSTDLTDEEQSQLRSEGSGEQESGIDWEALKAKKPTKVTSNTTGVSGGVSGGWGTVGLDGGTSLKTTTFEKQNDEGAVVTRTGTTKAETASLSLTIPPIGTVTGQATKTEIENDANPDNDGKYFNIKVNLPNLSLSNSILEQLSEKVGVIDFYDAGTTVRNIEKLLTTNLESAFEEPSSESHSMDLALEWNWMETQGSYALQYFRLNVSQSHSKSLPITEFPLLQTGVVGVTGEVNAEISASRSWGLYEKLSTKTLTYLHTLYNGLVRRQGGDADWAKYREAHKGQIMKLIQQVGDPESTPYKEAVAAGMKSDVLEKCRQAKLYPHEVDREALMAAFESYLQQVSKATTATSKKGWTPKS